MNDKIIIPLYINNVIIKSLFTIIINEFEESRTINSRNQMSININTPLSELTYDNCKKYIQGDMNIQFLNEFTREHTEKNISIDIEIMGRIRKILDRNNLLKKISTDSNLDKINEKDFVEFQCILKKNPILEYVCDIINAIEMELTFLPFDNSRDINKNFRYEVVEKLKKQVNDLANNKCLNYITEKLYGSNTRMIVPLENRYLLDNIDYIDNEYVTILGKITKKMKDDTNRNIVHMLNGTCFDLLNGECSNQFINKILINTDLIENYNSYLQNIDGSMIEVLPIAIYI